MRRASITPKRLDANVLSEKPSRDQNFRFSGHQTFPLRITWIPKAVAAIVAGYDPLTNIDEGITKLGLGKNMVEALRCWIETYQIADWTKGTWKLTTIGDIIFNPATGLDPYLEDISTSWLLHWLITTNGKAPFFAWECLFKRWPATEFSASQVLDAFEKESNKMPKPVSTVTLRQHWEIFLHTYRPSSNGKGEDQLDSALSILRLIVDFDERPSANGKWETVYSFNVGRKRTISQQLFAFFVHEWWNRCCPQERTVPLREFMFGKNSIGRILKMSESEILHRLNDLALLSEETFQIVESTNLRQLHRHRQTNGLAELRAAYKTPTFID